MTRAVAAVDLGATSGRVMLGYVDHNELALVPVSRFPNGPVESSDGLRWNASGLFEHVASGLAAASRQEPDIVSIGVDSWAVDYALMKEGRMLGEPFHYRDARTARGVAAVHELVSAKQLYAATGLQHLPFNTVFQLAEDKLAGRLHAADRFLLVPDLVNFWLTGLARAERTNASTTGLLNAETGRWDDSLIERAGLPRGIFAELIDAGAALGPVQSTVSQHFGLPTIPVTTVGSHDTASAIVAIPATDPDFAYISSGTWALVGVELESPVFTEASRSANFTNEGGVDGRVRSLRNEMGLWILTETLRSWGADLTEMLDAAAHAPAPSTLFDVNDARFVAPGDMPARIADWYGERGAAAPSTRSEIVRAILESLAEAYAVAVRKAVELTGKSVRVIHLVGGGSHNALLCQLTADRSGMPVLAGPAEATAIGNVLVQARAAGLVSGSLESLRAVVAAAFVPAEYRPRLPLS